MKLLQWDELINAGKHYRNIVYIQFRADPKKTLLSDYYRVCGYPTRFESHDYVVLERFGRGKAFRHDDGFKKTTYLKEWRAYLVTTDKLDINDEWED